MCTTRSAFQLQQSALPFGFFLNCRTTDYVQVGVREGDGRNATTSNDKAKLTAAVSCGLRSVETGSVWYADLVCQTIAYFAGVGINKIQMQSH